MSSPRPFASDTEWIARTEAVFVRIHTLAPGQGSPWHFHTHVDDDVFCMDDGIEVRMRGPEETVRLAPGQRQRIAAGRVHRVLNTGTARARYLLVQATGPYDFNEAGD